MGENDLLLAAANVLWCLHFTSTAMTHLRNLPSLSFHCRHFADLPPHFSRCLPLPFTLALLHNFASVVHPKPSSDSHPRPDAGPKLREVTSKSLSMGSCSLSGFDSLLTLLLKSSLGLPPPTRTTHSYPILGLTAKQGENGYRNPRPAPQTLAAALSSFVSYPG